MIFNDDMSTDGATEETAAPAEGEATPEEEKTEEAEA